MDQTWGLGAVYLLLASVGTDRHLCDPQGSPPVPELYMSAASLRLPILKGLGEAFSCHPALSHLFPKSISGSLCPSFGLPTDKMTQTS